MLAIAAVALGLRLKRQPREVLRTDDVNLGTARLVGQRVELATAIVNGRGTVRIADTVWQVAGPDLAAGPALRITGTDGITLKVAP